eukprot:5671544-Pleurochrysis_carterae.AAC.1
MATSARGARTGRPRRGHQRACAGTATDTHGTRPYAATARAAARAHGDGGVRARRAHQATTARATTRAR